MLKTIFRSKRQDMTEGWLNLQTEEFYNPFTKHRAVTNDLGHKKLAYFRNGYGHTDETTRKQQRTHY
jgi:hypothetical protein